MKITSNMAIFGEELKGTNYMGQTGFCKILRFPAVFCEHLRLPNAVLSEKTEKQQESAKISEEKTAKFGPCQFVPLIPLEFLASLRCILYGVFLEGLDKFSQENELSEVDTSEIL